MRLPLQKKVLPAVIGCHKKLRQFDEKSPAMVMLDRRAFFRKISRCWNIKRTFFVQDTCKLRLNHPTSVKKIEMGACGVAG